MKLDTATNTITQVGSGLSAGVMEFDADGAAHLMSILSNMYAHKEHAVVREYVCNAVDSHVAAGQTRPVELTLPTIMSPQLTVRDFGIGLSHDELIGVYSRYGKSTKRDDDTQIGAFGIGAKAGFTVSPQITVIGTKDGEQTVAVFSLDVDNTPHYDIVSRSGSDDPDGVLVQIAVDEHAGYEDAAREVLAALPPGSVTCDGIETGSLFTGAERIGERVWKRSTPTSRIVVMGGIAYPLEKSLVEQITDGDLKQVAKGLIVEVPLGALDLAPSREALRNSRRTLAALAAHWTAATQMFRKSQARALDRLTGQADRALFVATTRRYLPGFAPGVSVELPVPSSAANGPTSLLGDRRYLVLTDAGLWDRETVRRRIGRWAGAGPTPDVVLLAKDHDLGWGSFDTMTFDEFKTVTKRPVGSRAGQEFTYPVVGEKREWTLSELRAKGDGVLLADQKFREAINLVSELDLDVVVVKV